MVPGQDLYQRRAESLLSRGYFAAVADRFADAVRREPAGLSVEDEPRAAGSADRVLVWSGVSAVRAAVAVCDWRAAHTASISVCAADCGRRLAEGAAEP